MVIGENEDVFSSVLEADRVNFMSIPDLDGERQVMAKIRYNHKGAPCIVKKTGPDRVRVEFLEPQRAITPGQAVVFYDGEYVLGGGTIL